MDGDHTLDRCFEVTELMLHATFAALGAHRVQLTAMLLKPNMVVAGEDCAEQPSVEAAAPATLDCLRRSVPAAVPGVVFLSGGQGDVRATEHLHGINQLGRDAPWALSFSFGRALQSPALQAWRGVAENVSGAQRQLLHRARCNSAARAGSYSAEMERPPADGAQ